MSKLHLTSTETNISFKEKTILYDAVRTLVTGSKSQTDSSLWLRLRTATLTKESTTLRWRQTAHSYLKKSTKLYILSEQA